MLTAIFLKDTVFEYALPRPGIAPTASDETYAEAWQELAHNIGNLEQNASPQATDTDNYPDELRNLLQAVFEHSPYLTNCLMKEPQIFLLLCAEGREAALQSIFAATDALLCDEEKLADMDALMTDLRRLKRQISLVLGLVDLSGRIVLGELTEALSHFADKAIGVALAYVWRRFRERGYLTDGTDEVQGIFVLGLGKYGGFELNYSSDIDLILLFDANRLPFLPEHMQNIQEILNRGVKQFVKILDDANRDGFVFRVDLELRPDPLSTPPIISVDSALNYYAAIGQTWERAAFIKARTVAGDISAGDNLLAEMTPFIWRKSLDYYALNEIADIRSRMLKTKSRISETQDADDPTCGIGGFNVKLSYGGIREVEFLLQSQQLIWGGRNPFLRTATGMDALHRLVMEGILPERTIEPLTAAYAFLRQVEHRLQMLMNEQTQTLPKDSDALKRFSQFCGYEATDKFAETLLHHVTTACALSDEFGPKELQVLGVAEKTDSPNSDRPGSDSPDTEAASNLAALFGGAELNGDGAAILKSYGFNDTASAHQIISQWLSGEYRATKSEKSLLHLSSLLPILLEHIRDSGAADTTLVQFDQFLSQLPYGVQVFALLQAHSQLCRQLFAILGGAPTIGRWLSANPHLLDALLEVQVTHESDTALTHLSRARISLQEVLEHARDLQDVLQILTHWLNDQKFLCRMDFFNGIIDIKQLMKIESELAELTLASVLPQVIKEFNIANAARKGGDEAAPVVEDYFGLLAFGKFGSAELLPLSDLDIVFIFDADSDQEIGYGLSAMVYFVRLCQRILTALSAEGEMGKLYDVDMRLRPSGNKSSVATPVHRFADYYLAGEAWVWEWMTLLRGRTVWGSDKVSQKINDTIATIFNNPQDKAKIKKDLKDMWKTTRETHKGESIWDIKYRRGGLQDLEYIIYGLQLLHAAECPAILNKHGIEALSALHSADIINDAVCRDLTAAYLLWMSLSAAFKLICEAGDIKGDDFSAAQIESLGRMVERSCDVRLDSPEAIKQYAEQLADKTFAQFTALFGN